MKYLLIYLLLLNSAYFYAVAFKKTIAETLLPSFIIKILFLYISGLFGSFILGFWIIVVKNIIYLIYNAYQTFKNKANIKKIISIGNIIFTLAFVYFIWITHNRMISIWDEFTHWGLVVKNMFYLDNLAIGGNSSVVATHYLSGTSIFQYFLLKIYGTFNEGLMYFGQDLLLISIILPIFKDYELKSLKSINVYLLIFVSIFLPALCYWNLYTSIYVDCMLGFAFASLIYNYYTVEDGLFKKILMCLNFMFVIFVKDFGIALALLGFAIILIDQLFIRNKFQFKIKSIWNSIKYPLLYFAVALIIKITWSTYVGCQIESAARDTGLLETVLNLLNYYRSDGWQGTVIVNFIKELFAGNIIYFFTRISYIGVIVLFIFISYFIYKKDKLENEETKKSYKWLTFALVGGAACYAFALLCCYIGIFGEYEALRLASFNRYLGSYVVALLLISSFLLFRKYQKKETLQPILLIYFLILVLSMEPQSLYILTITNSGTKTATISQREAYLESEKLIRKNVKTGERVYTVITNSDGFEYWTLRYTISPILTNINQLYWSLGEPYSETDVWTKNYEVEEWKQILLDNYDYVYLFRVEEKFEKKYGKLFDSKLEDNQLYKVDKKKEKLVLVK